MGAGKSRSLNNCQQTQNYPPGLNTQGGAIPSMLPPTFGYGGFPNVNGFTGYPGNIGSYPNINGFPATGFNSGTYPNSNVFYWILYKNKNLKNFEIILKVLICRSNIFFYFIYFVFKFLFV